ncbi:hypothetical protein BKP35_01320 [Anaerobacillus arseniciselenatis]|uniref:Pilin n=1 Tax=Anaerobacillus arseniciselenatis TaxID=85682 RepID=A0A1S2LTK6_9BACI|nr:Flp family type IVb pilin [Anaerobacillus arseniciselenatis]OIJ15664.1 hypothetical protein BKP35_01320 [Anaerobacillus arseniciselenatis]
MFTKLINLFKEEKGQGMTEYGLILGLIALAVIAALFTMGGAIEEKFQEIISGITNNNAGNNPNN